MQIGEVRDGGYFFSREKPPALKPNETEAPHTSSSMSHGRTTCATLKHLWVVGIEVSLPAKATRSGRLSGEDWRWRQPPGHINGRPTEWKEKTFLDRLIRASRSMRTRRPRSQRIGWAACGRIISNSAQQNPRHRAGVPRVLSIKERP